MSGVGEDSRMSKKAREAWRESDKHIVIHSMRHAVDRRDEAIPPPAVVVACT